jgi:putative ABC transport system permease protein
MALFLSMAVSTAVLTGALIVGDSIRYSLASLVDMRLGSTRIAVTSGSGFIDTKLAAKLSESLKVPVSPLLMLRGIAALPESERRINNVNIIGIDSTYSSISKTPIPFPSDEEALIGSALANKLSVKPGDELLVRVESANPIPVNSPFAKEPVPTVAMRLKIKALATNDQLGGLNLGNDQSAPMNIFVRAHYLSGRLGLAGLSNALLVAGETGRYSVKSVTDSIRARWSLKDLGLSIEKTSGKNTFDLTSSKIFIDTTAENIISHAGLPSMQIVTYMINDIGFKDRHTPYSFAAAVSSTLAGRDLGANEAIINRWTAEDLGVRTGDSIKLTYFIIGALRQLHEESKSFIVRDIIENSTNKIDRSLMPRFQGMSEAENCRDWDAGVPIDLKRIRDKDEKYWHDYRGTPKVLISLNEGRKLWQNQFGALTAIRFNESDISEKKLESLLLNKSKPSDFGIQVLDVRHEGVTAAQNAVDFTELFLSLSFFVIAAGMLLTMLIYSLHFSRRSGETALLSGLGFGQKQIVWLRLAESSLVIITGSIAGSLLGILYNYVLVAALNSVWNDIVRTNMLIVHIRITSLLTGAIMSIILAVIPVYFVTVKRLKHPLAAQLKGNNETASARISGRNNKSVIHGVALLALALIIVAYSIVSGAYDEPVAYLLAAAIFLCGSLLLVNGILRKTIHSTGNSVPSNGLLALKNLQRNPSRSLAVIALLATGTFAIMITGSYRKTYYGSELIRKSGTGGYLLWAETTTRVPFNLNSPEGRERLLTRRPEELDGVKFLQFARLEGDDASCLNLNQAQRPRVLAVNPMTFDSAAAFSFVKLLPGIARDHPWKGLEATYNDAAYPAFADQNVIQYSLKKKLGDTLVYQGESGKKLKLVLAGAISNSIFQGNILISDKVFSEYFPSAGGSKTMLIDAPADKQKPISELLSQSLEDYGITVTPTTERLATFNSVENTYLTVFMALSGFGFLIGTIGLGIVLLRNIFERKRELALMSSLGYRRGQLFMIVFSENLILLAGGFVIGLLSAITGILPSLLSPAFNIEWSFLLIITTVVFISGVLWIYFPLRSALRKPLTEALRTD